MITTVKWKYTHRQKPINREVEIRPQNEFSHITKVKALASAVSEAQSTIT